MSMVFLSFQVLVREDQFQPWNVSESTAQISPCGRGFLGVSVENSNQYTLGNVSDRSGYHVLRRPPRNLLGLLWKPAVSVLNVASDQFGLWNVSGSPLSVFLLPNTSEVPKITSAKATRAPSDGASILTEVASVPDAEVGGIFTSHHNDNEARVFTTWPGKDDKAVLLVATFKNGKAHLWATRAVKTGTSLVFLPGCIEGKSPTVSRSCAEHDFRSTILALYAAGNSRSNEHRNAPAGTGPSTPSTETGE